MKGNNSSFAGQMTFDFSVYKNQQTIKYPGVPKAYLLFDEKDTSIIENFKQNFTGIKYIENKEICSGDVDYFLIFLSIKGLMNEEFLKVFFDVYDDMDNGKVVGLIIDDDLRKFDRRLELYNYYHNKFIKICDFKKEKGSNADIMRCGDVYERCYEKIGAFLNKLLNDEKNQKICAEDKFETCLKNDGKNGLRTKHKKMVDDENVGEENCMETKNEYNNCTIVNADQGNQISLAQGNENHIQQKQGIEKDELEIICETITKDIQCLNEEEKAQLQSMLEDVQKEFRDSKNAKGIKLPQCLSLVASMLAIANGTPTLLQNITNLQSFLLSNIT